MNRHGNQICIQLFPCRKNIRNPLLERIILNDILLTPGQNRRPARAVDGRTIGDLDPDAFRLIEVGAACSIGRIGWGRYTVFIGIRPTITDVTLVVITVVFLAGCFARRVLSLAMIVPLPGVAVKSQGRAF